LEKLNPKGLLAPFFMLAVQEVVKGLIFAA
jgi:hypothetical protein